jgi:hypothetical protein
VFHRIVVPELQPVSQLSLEEGLDGPLYQALGEDPQFELKAEPGWHKLAPGWYRFTARFTVAEGEVVKPCLYPDYGEGLAEHARIDLPEPGPDGRIDGVIVIARRLRYLRFDPTSIARASASRECPSGASGVSRHSGPCWPASRTPPAACSGNRRLQGPSISCAAPPVDASAMAPVGCTRDTSG